MQLRRRRSKVYKREIFYQQWTGCPSCGYVPVGPPVQEPVLLRNGITNDAGNRFQGGYQGDRDASYFDHVAVITLAHHRPGTSREAAKRYEAERIDLDRPPFNVQGNPDYAEQAIQRRRILGQPVRWVDVRHTTTARVRRWVTVAAWWLLSLAGVLAALALAVAARQ